MRGRIGGKDTGDERIGRMARDGAESGETGKKGGFSDHFVENGIPAYLRESGSERKHKFFWVSTKNGGFSVDGEAFEMAKPNFNFTVD
jgi:hypothetical protein